MTLEVIAAARHMRIVAMPTNHPVQEVAMSKVISGVRAPLLVLFLSQAIAAAALAQAATSKCPPGLPPGVYCGERDAKQASAGTYVVDPLHTAVLARVSHIGYSYLVFRFDKAEGKLTWDPAAPAKSSLSVSVETASLVTNVPDFAKELTGDNFLKSSTHPKATFVSTAFRPTDATRGKVEGQFTLMGKTKPVTFDVTLVGAGKGFMDKPRIGAEARAWINPQDYGLPPMMLDPIEIVIDAEFEKAS
jgi:polyisoprenoid-binding protein YceI